MIAFGVLLAGYVFWRAIHPLPIHWAWKIVLAVAVAMIALKFHLLSLIGGPMFFAPELPESVLLIAAWLFSSIFIFFFLLLGANIVTGGVYLFRLCLRKKPKCSASARTTRNNTNTVLLMASFLLATVGIINGTSVPDVREETVILNHLPQEADGMTIAVLADLHADSMTRADRIQAIVNRTNATNPDIIVIAGDFVDGTVEARGNDLLPLQKLSARYGVYGVPGNHEYYSGYEQWMKCLPELGVKMILNEHVIVGRDKRSIVLAGVTDPSAGRSSQPLPSIERALRGATHDTAQVLLSHQPKLAPEASRYGADLQISGHTHGGMIVGIDRMVSMFNSGYVSGLYRVGDMMLFVSNGSGIWNGFPIRLGVPSEIVLLRLKKA